MGTTLAEWLKRERDQKVTHGLYHNTQLVFAYNSNHMEGSTLTAEQTAQLYDTGELLPDGDDIIRADDVIETTNHFRAFDWMLDHVDDPDVPSGRMRRRPMPAMPLLRPATLRRRRGHARHVRDEAVRRQAESRRQWSFPATMRESGSRHPSQAR